MITKNKLINNVISSQNNVANLADYIEQKTYIKQFFLRFCNESFRE